ncbi:MAG: DUF86 domain-containing protein [Firmicutes bacterium]|nr:DUF86 domain-containing protein [Bacillota bacterium]
MCVRKTSSDIKEKFSDVPWGEIIALRNRLVHEYWGINYKKLLEICKHEVPKLKVKVQEILAAI